MLQEKLKEWDRVIKLSRKPRKDEFIMVAKITGLGMIVVGAIGFIIRLLIQITGIVL
jgi:protein transport protein SEC61 subunit gamma-like protein